MEKMKIGIIIVSVVFTGFAVTWISALPQPSTPLYTFRMEQASSKMNFLSTETSDFVYITEKGYTLNNSGQGCCQVHLDTGVWTCYYSTCGGPTCVLTCPESCHGTCNDPTCPETCNPTCPETCNPTCNDPTCPNTCGDTHQYTCSTCEETCEHTCPLTCDDPTCLETCSGFTCYETCPETCSPTCIDPTCVDPTCLETCLETCSQDMC